MTETNDNFEVDEVPYANLLGANRNLPLANAELERRLALADRVERATMSYADRLEGELRETRQLAHAEFLETERNFSDIVDEALEKCGNAERKTRKLERSRRNFIYRTVCLSSVIAFGGLALYFTSGCNNNASGPVQIKDGILRYDPNPNVIGDEVNYKVGLKELEKLDR